MKYLVEFDASGQEARFMAVKSRDHQMMRIFENDEDFHSHTGSAISGIPYAEFMDRKRQKDPEITGEHGLRYCGKFIGLSSQYRTSARTLRIRARVDYGLIKDFATIKRWQAAYHRKYPGVGKYWRVAIARAKEVGYAETLAGRRYYIHDWTSEGRWGSESSAINFPIQGSGADMKELAIACMSAQFPMFEFAFDLHDGLFYWLEIDEPLPLIKKAKYMLDNLPYKEVWGWEPPIPMPWDAAITATSWGEIQEVKV